MTFKTLWLAEKKRANALEEQIEVARRSVVGACLLCPNVLEYFQQVEEALVDAKSRDLLHVSQMWLGGAGPTDIFHSWQGGKTKLLTRLETGDTLYVVRAKKS